MSPFQNQDRWSTSLRFFCGIFSHRLYSIMCCRSMICNNLSKSLEYLWIDKLGDKRQISGTGAAILEGCICLHRCNPQQISLPRVERKFNVRCRLISLFRPAYRPDRDPGNEPIKSILVWLQIYQLVYSSITVAATKHKVRSHTFKQAELKKD